MTGARAAATEPAPLLSVTSPQPVSSAAAPATTAVAVMTAWTVLRETSENWRPTIAATAA